MRPGRRSCTTVLTRPSFIVSNGATSSNSVFGHRTHYLLARRGVEIVGVLPLAQVKSLLFGHSLVSLPFAVYGGAAVTDEQARVLLHAAAAELARQLQVDYLELRNRSSYEPGWPQQDLFVTFRRPIAPDAEANMLAIPRKQRAMVRKGMQRGLASEIDADVDRFFDLYADNAHRHGTPPFAEEIFRERCSKRLAMPVRS